MKDYITVKEIAKKWNITERQVQILCKEGRVEGVIKISGVWLIPINSIKPTNHKRKGNGNK